MQTYAPNLSSVGWLLVYIALSFLLVVILAACAWLAGWARKQWMAEAGHTKGERASSSGVAHVPPTNLATRLYVGEMGVDANRLATEQIIEIWGRCFNATGHSLWLHRVKGKIELGLQSDGTVRKLGMLPPPLILAERAKTENLADATEIFFVLEQRIPHEFTEILQSVTDAKSVQLLFEDLAIVLASHESATVQLEMPLWGGVRLYRNPERIQSSRIFIMRVETATLGGVKNSNSGATKIPLIEAATRCLEQTEHTIIPTFDKMFDNTPDGRLGWHCNALWERAPIYGVEPPSRNVKQFPWAKWRHTYSMEVENGVAFLKHRYENTRIEKLEIGEEDLRKAIAALLAIAGDDQSQPEESNV